MFDQADLSGGSNPLEIDCEDAPKDSTQKFTKCEKEEICGKIAHINEDAKNNKGPYGGLKRIRKSAYKVNRSDGDNLCSNLNKAAQAGKPADLGFHKMSPECEAETRKKAEDSDYNSVSADHVNEIQVGGHPTAGSNLRWMSRGPNSWMGGQMKKFKAPADSWGRTEGGPHTGLKQKNCC